MREVIMIDEKREHICAYVCVTVCMYVLSEW